MVTPYFMYIKLHKHAFSSEERCILEWVLINKLLTCSDFCLKSYKLSVIGNRFSLYPCYLRKEVRQEEGAYRGGEGGWLFNMLQLAKGEGAYAGEGSY